MHVTLARAHGPYKRIKQKRERYITLQDAKVKLPSLKEVPGYGTAPLMLPWKDRMSVLDPRNYRGHHLVLADVILPNGRKDKAPLAYCTTVSPGIFANCAPRLRFT